MKFGGYKLSALEIEAVLLEHPAVSECCVLGLADKTYREVVCMIVVPSDEIKRKQQEELKPALTLEELCSWTIDRLAPCKLPTKFYLWESLPRNALGKINDKALVFSPRNAPYTSEEIDVVREKWARFFTHNYLLS